MARPRPPLQGALKNIWSQLRAAAARRCVNLVAAIGTSLSLRAPAGLGIKERQPPHAAWLAVQPDLMILSSYSRSTYPAVPRCAAVGALPGHAASLRSGDVAWSHRRRWGKHRFLSLGFSYVCLSRACLDILSGFNNSNFGPPKRICSAPIVKTSCVLPLPNCTPLYSIVGSPVTLSSSSFGRSLQKNNTTLFVPLDFPCVCPEPVLAKTV